jgi:type IX secretion system PorP/SprF family membrane protein
VIIIGFKMGIIAQESPLYTQYMQNPFVLNPAVAGTYNYYQIATDHRFQWIGFPDAPVTNSISFFGPFSSTSKNMGLGFTLYDDITNPTSQLGLRGSYAYNTAITSLIRVSFGATLGALQYKYDGSQSNVPYYDPAAPKTVINKFLPDGAAGIIVYSTNFFGGISADNLFNGSVSPDQNSPLLGHLQRHFYLLGSYTEIFSRKWSGEASGIVKMVSSVAQFEFDAKMFYQKMLWFGLSYRQQDAISVLLGYYFTKKIYVGYSYDYNISAIRNYSFGSHELMIGYKFDKLK